MCPLSGVGNGVMRRILRLAAVRRAALPERSTHTAGLPAMPARHHGGPLASCMASEQMQTTLIPSATGDPDAIRQAPLAPSLRSVCRAGSSPKRNVGVGQANWPFPKRRFVAVEAGPESDCGQCARYRREPRPRAMNAAATPQQGVSVALELQCGTTLRCAAASATKASSKRCAGTVSGVSARYMAWMVVRGSASAIGSWIRSMAGP